VPKFILQPLVENAIKHGQRGVSSGGIISITAREAPEGTLMIAVEDNGHGMDAEQVRRIREGLDRPETETDDHYSIGLSNVHQRIRILFGDAYGLDIQSEPEVKTVVSIRMPARRKEELEAYVQSDHRG
jgi:sensor histidine kinase YesM